MKPSPQLGRVIILNGPSSSGKSTIARAVQSRLEEPPLHLDVDVFRQMFPPDYFEVPDRAIFRSRVARTLMAVNRVAAALAAGGDDVIVDIVLPRWDILQDAIELFRPYQVLFVALHCPVEELERRELARGRRAGRARSQVDWVHRAGAYDLELDTSVSSPAECASQILAALATPPSPTAFEQLRARFLRGEIQDVFFRDS